jgi:WD40 repeat protein
LGEIRRRLYGARSLGDIRSLQYELDDLLASHPTFPEGRVVRDEIGKAMLAEIRRGLFQARSYPDLGRLEHELDVVLAEHPNLPDGRAMRDEIARAMFVEAGSGQSPAPYAGGDPHQDRFRLAHGSLQFIRLPWLLTFLLLLVVTVVIVLAYWFRKIHKPTPPITVTNHLRHRLAISSDASLIAETQQDHSVVIWKLSGKVSPTLKRQRVLTSTRDRVDCATFSPDGKSVFGGDQMGNILVWDLLKSAGKPVKIIALPGHCGVTCLAPAQNHRWLLAGTTTVETGAKVGHTTPHYGGSVFRVDLLGLTKPQPLTTTDESVTGVALQSDDSTFVVGSKSVERWRARKQLNTYVKTSEPESVALAYAGKSARVCAGGRDGFLGIYNLETTKKIQEFPSQGCVCSMAFPEGNHVLTGNRKGEVRLWDARNPKNPVTIGMHSKDVTGLVYTPDRKNVISVSEDGQIRIWPLHW